MSSLEPVSPTVLPSNSIANVPNVVMPSLVGKKAIISSSLALLHE
jgi:hypothetical protein